jgi:hypothetical protein
MKRNRRTRTETARRNGAVHESARRDRGVIADEYSPAVHNAVRYMTEHHRRSYPSGSMC